MADLRTRSLPVLPVAALTPAPAAANLRVMLTSLPAKPQFFND